MNYFNYFSEIEETFNRRRGKHLFLSPLDWTQIEVWQQRGVPLHIVLRGIEKVFDGIDAQPNRRRSVKSLMYCREEIDAQYEEWLERQVGKSENSKPGEDSGAAESAERSVFSNDAVQTHLETVSTEISAAVTKADGELRDVLERVTARLAELKENFADAESLEDSLSDLEKILDTELLKNSDAELKKEIEKQLHSYKGKMSAETYRQTFDLMLLKRLREKAAIPRLSLFYL